MTTIDEILPSSFVKNCSQDIDNRKQYSNFNLNQNSKCSILIPVQIFSTSNDNDFDEFSGLKASIEISDSTAANYCEEKENFKLWNNLQSKFLTSNDKSEYGTISLHISTSEFVASGSFGDKINESHKLKINEQQNAKQIFTASKFVIQNPFEFSRQQSDKTSKPEVSQFKASQRLFNPNKASKKASKNDGSVKEDSATGKVLNKKQEKNSSQKDLSEMAPLPPMERLRLLIIDHESRFGRRAANISKEEANERDIDINELLPKYNLIKNYYNVNKRSATRTIRNREKKNQCPPTGTKTENEAPEAGKKQLKPPQKEVKSRKLAGRPRNAVSSNSTTSTTTTSDYEESFVKEVQKMHMERATIENDCVTNLLEKFLASTPPSPELAAATQKCVESILRKKAVEEKVAANVNKTKKND